MGGVGEKRTTPFSILIVGAGIGGLAAAIALSRRGLRVTVLEAQSDLNEFGASIAIYPFAARILRSYGLDALFKDRVLEVDIELHDGYTDQKLGHLVRNKANTARVRYGAPSWNIHRADYQQILADAARKYGTEIRFDANLEKVDIDSQTVHLRDGRQLSADLIVGADGLRSPVRTSIPATASAEFLADPEIAFRCSVPKERMRSNPLLAPLLAGTDSVFWFMEGRYVLSWVLPPDRDFDVAACVAAPENEYDLPLGSWGTPTDPAQVVEAFSDAHPTVRALVSEISSAVAWRIAELEPLSTCRSPNGQTVLCGDAWHAMLPHNGAGGSAALEDGAVLGECVAWAAEHGRSIAEATRAYEEVQMPRVLRIQESSRSGRGIMSASGKAREARNAGLAAQMAADELELKLSEEERKARVPEMDMSARWPSSEYLQWLDGYDALEETRRYLAKQLL